MFIIVLSLLNVYCTRELISEVCYECSMIVSLYILKSLIPYTV